MLIPKRTKYRKPHRVSYEGKAKGNIELTQGEYGLMAKEGAYITARQIEAARIAMTRYMKSFKRGKVFINIFPHLARTKVDRRDKRTSHITVKVSDGVKEA